MRRWCDKVGREYAKRLKRSRGPVGDTWHLDEVYLKINGDHQYLWRAVDREEQVIDILIQSLRDARAAERFFRKVLRLLSGQPGRIVTNQLGSYSAAIRRLVSGFKHVRDKGANNRAENSHQPTRERERRRRRFRSASKAQRFLSTFSAMSNHFRQARHLMKAKYHRIMMGRCFAKLRAVSASVA